MNNRMLSAAGASVVAIALLLSPTSAVAQGRGHGKPAKPAKAAKVDKPSKPVDHDRTRVADRARTRDNGGDRERERDHAAAVLFDRHDRGVIQSYYSGLPPGLAKRNGDLPPGLERQLQRNGVLPPGLRARIRPFPEALERQLTPLPRGYRRGILDRHVVVYRTDNYRIGDSIFDVLR